MEWERYSSWEESSYLPALSLRGVHREGSRTGRTALQCCGRGSDTGRRPEEHRFSEPGPSLESVRREDEKEEELSENKYITEAMRGINGVRALYSSGEESSYLPALSRRGGRWWGNHTRSYRPPTTGTSGLRVRTFSWVSPQGGRGGGGAASIF